MQIDEISQETSASCIQVEHEYIGSLDYIASEGDNSTMVIEDDEDSISSLLSIHWSIFYGR